MKEEDKITLIIAVGLFIAGAVIIIQLLSGCSTVTVNVAAEDSVVEDTTNRKIDNGLIDVEVGTTGD